MRGERIMKYDFFSDRELGKKEQKLEEISVEVYDGIVGIYEKFKIYLGRNFPEYCYDSNSVICGIEENNFVKRVKSLIQGFVEGDRINYHANFNEWDKVVSEKEQYQLFDFIEFIYNNIQDYKNIGYHEFLKHNHLEYFPSKKKQNEFQREINQIFQRNGLAYKLNNKGQIERILPKGLENEIEMYKELIPNKDKELFELINLGLEKIKNPKLEENQIALEKLWDAFERIKTYYGEKDGRKKDKKKSINELIENISEGNKLFKDFINTEYDVLAKAGNEIFQIRHYEKNNIGTMVKLSSKKHIDYLFYRMLSLLTLSLMYTK